MRETRDLLRRRHLCWPRFPHLLPRFHHPLPLRRRLHRPLSVPPCRLHRLPGWHPRLRPMLGSCRPTPNPGSGLCAACGRIWNIQSLKGTITSAGPTSGR
jgi:hypothetical protein